VKFGEKGEMSRKAEVWKLLNLVFIIVFALSAVSTVHAASVTATITVGTSPTGIVYDSAKGEVFVANSGYNTVSVISDSNNAVIKTVTVGISPTGLAYDFGKGEIFVTNHGSNSVSVISDSNNSVVATIPVGTNPNNLAYDSGKNEIFVVNSGDNTVSVISDSTNAVITTVPVGTNPNKIIYDSGKGELFVSNSGHNTISVISDSNNTVVATITVGISPAGAAYDSGKGEIFVANYGSGENSVSVISDSNNTVVTTIPVGTTPYGVAYNFVTSEIFVSNHGSNSVSVISDSNNSVVATIPVGTTPAGVAYDSGKNEIFVTNIGDNTASVISDSSPSTSPTPVPSASPSPATSSSPTPNTFSTASSTASPTSSSAQTTAPLSTPDLLQQVWVPKPANALAAVGVSALAIGAISLVFAAVSNPLGGLGGQLAEKTKGLIPDSIKQWLEEVVSSRRKLDTIEKKGPRFKPTKTEILAYIVSIVVLAISFSYVKVITLSQIWAMLPVFFVTSIVVGFVQKFFSIVYLRSKGVWSEHKIWPFGLVLFLFTTFAFKVPFSSPTRSVNQSSKFTERLGALVAASGILINLAFGGLFFLILKGGYVAIGGAGLDMCVIGSFFGTFPVAPMSGKDIFDHNKLLWAGLFIATTIVFAAWLLLMQ
jgi:YVTN family beta-propeller protein